MVELTSWCAHFCRCTLMQMEGHSLAVGHMQRLSKTRGCPQSLQDKGQEVEKVLAKLSANASLGPRAASFPVFVPPRAALAECQSTICGSRAGCRQVHSLSTWPMLRAITLNLPQSAFRSAVHDIIPKLLWLNCALLSLCLSRNLRG